MSQEVQPVDFTQVRYRANGSRSTVAIDSSVYALAKTLWGDQTVERIGQIAVMASPYRRKKSISRAVVSAIAAEAAQLIKPLIKQGV